jgi:hypothetical protein
MGGAHDDGSLADVSQLEVAVAGDLLVDHDL